VTNNRAWAWVGAAKQARKQAKLDSETEREGPVVFFSVALSHSKIRRAGDCGLSSQLTTIALELTGDSFRA